MDQILEHSQIGGMKVAIPISGKKRDVHHLINPL